MTRPTVSVQRTCAAFFALVLAPIAVAQQPTLERGKPAPDFVSRTLDGRDVKLSDYRGKIVVLDFWATWCGPCKASLPSVQALAKEQKGNDVVVLAVCTSDLRAKFRAWMQQEAAKYPDVVFTCEPFDRGSDEFDDRASLKHYRVQGLPTKFVIGRDGVVVRTLVGWDAGELRVEAALREAGAPIDAEVARKGAEQIEAAEAQAAREAAEAARRPVPAFFPGLMGFACGDPVPDLVLLGPDGKETKLSEHRGAAQIVALCPLDSMPRRDLQAIAQRYQPYGVRTIVLAVMTGRADYEAFAQKDQAKYAFAAFGDPAGVLDDAAQATPQQRMELHGRSLIGKLFGQGGMYPAMPAFFVLDGKGRMVGSFQRNAKMHDGIANLLLKAGVTLSAADQPAEVAPATAWERPKPRTPEPEVRAIALGGKAPDFAMNDAAGKSVRLSDFRGKVVVLDFWATWCGPCKAALPHVQAVAANYKDQDVVVLASCTSDARDAFDSFVRVNGPKYPDLLFAHDPLEKSLERASRKLYGVTGIPQQYVIDREGTLVAEVSGYRDGEVLLDAALAKAGVRVDAATLKQAAEDQRKRNPRDSKVVPAMPMRPLAPAGGK